MHLVQISESGGDFLKVSPHSIPAVLEQKFAGLRDVYDISGCLSDYFGDICDFFILIETQTQNRENLTFDTNKP